MTQTSEPNLIDRVRAYFAPAEKEIQGPSETAYSEDSLMYSRESFGEKYNPDALIGRKGYAIYKRMMQDEQVKAAVHFKRDAITSRDYQFCLDGEKYGLTPDEVNERISLFSEIISEMDGSFQDSLNGILSALYNGMSISEKVLRKIEHNGLTWQGVEKIKVKPFNTFKFDVDEYGNTKQLLQCAQGQLDRKLDMGKFIHYVVNPDIDEHYGESELRAAYRAWFSKENIIKFRNMWLERHAGGMRWAQIREGKNLNPESTSYTSLQNVMERITTATGMIMPPEVELMSDYPSATDAFNAAIKECDLQIARALLVPPLLGVSPQGDTGSYSQSSTQLEAFFWTLEAITKRLEEALNEQLFKQLGKINYPDGGYPRIKFKPLSKAATIEMLSKWKELAEANVVSMTSADEDYIRELLDWPEATDNTDADSVNNKPDLTTEELAVLAEYLGKVENASLKQEMAIELIITGLPISRERATELVNMVEVKEVEDLPNNPDGLPDDENEDEMEETPKLDDDGNPIIDENGQPVMEQKPKDTDNGDEGEPEKRVLDETVMGIGRISTSAFKRAQSRVNFAKIANDSDEVIAKTTQASAQVGDIIVKDSLIKAKDASPNLEGDVFPAIEAVSDIDSKHKKSLNNIYRGMLQAGIEMGTNEAEREVDMAGAENFCRDNGREFKRNTRKDFIADDYFQTTAFKLAGDLSAEYTKLIENVILEGSRAGWTWQETEKEVYAQLASKGMISEELAKDQLGAALKADANPSARLQTIAKTSTFDAINNARDSYFRDPQLDGFVQAYEYSAILDSRTTNICRHLDEQDEGNHSLEWYSRNSGFKPPNHYNCRSLLIPVTVNDLEEYVEGPEPTVSPQVGFGG